MKNSLKNSEILGMLITIILSTFIGIGVHSLVRSSGVDAWISVLISFISSTILVLGFLITFNYEKDLTISEKSIKLFGKPIGIFFNISFCLIAFITGMCLLFDLVSFIESQFLYNTPTILISIIFCLLIIYLNIKGTITISRVGFIIFIINAILFLIPLFALGSNFDFDNIKPILAKGYSDPTLGALRLSIINGFSIFLFSIFPKSYFKDNEKSNKYIILSFIISLITIFLVTIITIGVLGIDLTASYQYPEYMVLKRINLFNFLNRIENIIVLLWLNGIFYTASFVVYFISHSIKKKDDKIIPIIITALILFISHNFFKNNTFFEYFNYNILPFIRIYGIILVFIMVIKILFIKFKNKEKIL